MPPQKDPYTYTTGFSNTHSLSTTRLPPSIAAKTDPENPPPSFLPLRGNNPHTHPHNLFTEQLSGTSFTCPRHLNARTWLYRIRPSVGHTPFVPARLQNENLLLSSFTNLGDERLCATPTQLRWSPFEAAKGAMWLESLRTLAGAGETQLKNGVAVHVYGFTRGMEHSAFYNSDGDLLFIPVKGALKIRTEFGWFWVGVGEVFVVQRGVKFAVFPGGAGGDGEDVGATGYVVETFSGMHFQLPELGPIGSNGLADPKDFLFATPDWEEVVYPLTVEGSSSTSISIPSFTLYTKFLGQIHKATQLHSCFDVPAYSGNYLPYKYPLEKFCPMGNTSFDHADPSIFTVLTLPSPSLGAGTALVDIALFPPRWLCAEGTFRPPWFHRNVMSELMINIKGEYDAKSKNDESGGFPEGACSLHGMNAAHGPDVGSWRGEMGRVERVGGDKPGKAGEGSLAVMVETGVQLVTTRWAVEGAQTGYWRCWEGFEGVVEGGVWSEGKK